MKISDIDAFAAVVRCQTLSQAAAELGMTQPAITRRVQNLEEALGVTLLDRNTKPPRPTDIGRRVFEQCRAILREVDALRELTAGEQPPAGEFRIATQGLGELMLPALIAELAAQWPALATQVTTAWGGCSSSASPGANSMRHSCSSRAKWCCRRRSKANGCWPRASSRSAAGRLAAPQLPARRLPRAWLGAQSGRLRFSCGLAARARRAGPADAGHARHLRPRPAAAERRERLRYRTDAAAARRRQPAARCARHRAARRFQAADRSVAAARHDAARFDAPLAAVAAHARTAFALPEQAHGKAA